MPLRLQRDALLKKIQGIMPLYEYLCSECAHNFERIVKFSDAPLTTCPQCGKETVRQKISAPAVQFKGSGWYVTDYAHKSSASTPSKSEAAPAASTDKSTPAPSSSSASTGASNTSSST
jgi:putative FmdB family regulatory protein